MELVGPTFQPAARRALVRRFSTAVRAQLPAAFVPAVLAATIAAIADDPEVADEAEQALASPGDFEAAYLRVWHAGVGHCRLDVEAYPLRLRTTG